MRSLTKQWPRRFSRPAIISARSLPLIVPDAMLFRTTIRWSGSFDCVVSRKVYRTRSMNAPDRTQNPAVTRRSTSIATAAGESSESAQI